MFLVIFLIIEFALLTKFMNIEVLNHYDKNENKVHLSTMIKGKENLHVWP